MHSRGGITVDGAKLLLAQTMAEQKAREAEAERRATRGTSKGRSTNRAGGGGGAGAPRAMSLSSLIAAHGGAEEVLRVPRPAADVRVFCLYSEFLSRELFREAHSRARGAAAAASDLTESLESKE